MNRSRQFNLKPDSHFESLIAQTNRSRQSLSVKRKVSELIIQELEEEGVGQPKTNKPSSKLSRKDSGFDIQDSFYGENRPPRLATTSVLVQSASSSVKRGGTVRIESLLEEEEINELASSTFRNKDSHSNIVEIEEVEDHSRPSSTVFNYKPKSQKQVNTRFSIDQLFSSPVAIQQSTCQEIRIEEIKDGSISRPRPGRMSTNEASKKRIEHDLLISDDEDEKSRQISSPLVSGRRNKQTPIKPIKLMDLFSQSSELKEETKSSLEIDENIDQGDETIVEDTGNKKGTEWLKEINDKLNQTGYLPNGANSNDIDSNKKTSPTLLTVNTSSLFLNSADLKRRKVKYVKNGLAERLQKLLIRQASSINFIKHHMNKRAGSPSDQNQVLKHLPNVIRAVPFHKQSFYNGHFCLLHAMDAEKLCNDSNRSQSAGNSGSSSTIMILMDSKSIDAKYLNLAEDNSSSETRKQLLVMNIYPPWKKIHLSESKSDVYFNISLIEVENLIATKSTINFQTRTLFHFNISQTSSSKLLFRVNDLIGTMKRANDKQALNSINSHLLFSQTQRAANLITVSTEDQYMQQISSTQYMNVNSILDALENVGYYGFVTFKATVQRVGLNKSPTQYSQMPVVSSFQTQTSGSSQESQFRHHVIVSDKCGMFALITFPLSFDFSVVTESHKYQFNSLKFLEKQVLSPRENPLIHDQINYLWIEMNEKLKAKSRPTLKSYQKNIFIFEFMSSNRSWLDSFGSSNNYISLPIFSSLKNVTNHIQKNKLKKLFFNLNNLILLKLVDLNDGHFSYSTQTTASAESKSYMVFFVDKTSLTKSSDSSQTPSIYSIGLQTPSQINSSQLLANLHKNYIAVDDNGLKEEDIVCLKNLQLEETDSHDFKLDSNLYTSFDLIKSDSLNDLNYDLELQEANFFDNQTIDVRKLFNEPSREVKEFEFVQFTGQVINTVLEDCIVRGSCCSERIASTKEFICSECNSHLVQLDLTVVLNCVGIGRHVRVRLHRDTVNKIVPLCEQLSTYRSKQRFDFTFLTKKPIGPLLCFVSQINDFEIIAEELFILNKVSR